MTTSLVFFAIFLGLVVVISALRSFRANRGAGTPGRGVQSLLLLGTLGLCIALTYGAWWQSGQGTGLSTDLKVAVSADQGGRGVVLIGTSIRHGSRRGRTHRGRGLHGGK
jgi:hypothetical protein